MWLKTVGNGGILQNPDEQQRWEKPTQKADRTKNKEIKAPSLYHSLGNLGLLSIN